jgi:hypothetical protein
VAAVPTSKASPNPQQESLQMLLQQHQLAQAQATALPRSRPASGTSRTASGIPLAVPTTSAASSRQASSGSLPTESSNVTPRGTVRTQSRISMDSPSPAMTPVSNAGTRSEVAVARLRDGDHVVEIPELPSTRGPSSRASGHVRGPSGDAPAPRGIVSGAPLATPVSGSSIRTPLAAAGAAALTRSPPDDFMGNGTSPPAHPNKRPGSSSQRPHIIASPATTVSPMGSATASRVGSTSSTLTSATTQQTPHSVRSSNK